MPTLTAYENRVLASREHVIATRPDLPIPGKRNAKTIARMLFERQARMTDLDLERILTHSDPTPKQAFKNMETAA
ncbi:MAG: hypothetical protein M3536_00960 [Actinomycetota bacterium]|nr:hypothetical protein [Actinomycetota bacterium]